MRSESITQQPHENKVRLPEIDYNEWCTQTSVYNVVGIKIKLDSDGYQTYYTVPITGLSNFMAFGRPF